MSQTHQNRGGPRQNWDLYYPDGLAELAVDGIAEIMVGTPICKLTLFQTRPADHSELSKTLDERVENRQAVLMLTMNLQTLVESFSGVLASIAHASPQLRDAILAQQSATKALLDRLEKGVPTATDAAPIATPALTTKELAAIGRRPRRH